MEDMNNVAVHGERHFPGTLLGAWRVQTRICELYLGY